MMVLVAREQPVRIGIAPGADHVMDGAAVFVEAVPVEGVVGDRRHRPQVRQARPELVAGRQMRAVKRPRLAGEEALVDVVRGPEVQVTHLRPFDAHDPEEAAGRHVEGARVPGRHDHLVHLLPAVARRAIGGEIRSRQGLDGIADDGSDRCGAHSRRQVRILGPGRAS